jgi:hypothetical protein
MTRAQIIGNGLRVALLVTAGSTLIGVPFLMGLDAAPLVTGVLVGSTAIALAAGLAALIMTSVTRYSAGTA